MNVFLVVPRTLSPKQTYREYPLGAGLIATSLRRAGCHTIVYDQSAEGSDDESLWARLAEFQPDVVGFSVVTPSYPVASQQIRQLRAQRPDLPMVAGGIHASLFPDDFLADGADAVVVGDGCGPMTFLVDRIRRGLPWDTIPGLIGRTREGRSFRNAPARRLPNIDPGIIDRNVYNLSLYSHHSMLASLGCPYRCTFCCNFSGRLLQQGVTIRSCDRLCEEIDYLVACHGAKQIFFVDDIFLVQRTHALEFCRKLARRQPGLQWIAQMRADALDEEVAAEMAAAGCRRIYFGVESGSEAVLRRVRKGTDRESIRLGIESAKKVGIRVKTGWVFGLPGTLDEQYESVAFMRELRPHEISIHQLIPFPGTEYYAHPQRHGIRIRDPKDFASFCYGGMGDSVSFDYLSRGQLIDLLEHTVDVLQSDGYTNSDVATAETPYVFSTPLNSLSMSVFHSPGPNVRHKTSAAAEPVVPTY
jgi:radical SAM superfamily enzyme YgiQ (UPF0313 family)